MKKINIVQVLQYHLGEEFDRFGTAQLLYILSISFGWYMPDILRRLFFVAALFITPRCQRKIETRRWDGLATAAMIALLTLLSWIILDPVFFGDEILIERLKGVARPLEVALYVYGAILFAKDKFFVKWLGNISICSGIFFSTFSFVQRASLGFVRTNEIEWVFCKYTVHAGVIVLALLPWFFYKLFTTTKLSMKKILIVIGIFEMMVIAVLTYYVTIWISLASQLLFFAVYLFCNRKMFVFNFKKAALAMAALLSVLFALSYMNVGVRDEMREQYMQLYMINKSFASFTTDRGEIWAEALNLVNTQKATGFGWVEYNDYAVIKKHHPHSSYIQAAFHTGIPGALLYVVSMLLLFLLAVKKIFIEKDYSPIPFVALSVLILFCVAGLVESFFFVRRQIMIPYWSTVCLLFSPSSTMGGWQNICDDITCSKKRLKWRLFKV